MTRTATARQAFKAAEDVLKTLGQALADLQVYTHEHRRFDEAIVDLSKEIDGFFESNESFHNLTFRVHEAQIEFQGVPLTRLGHQGARLVPVLARSKHEAFQFLPGVTHAELGRFVRALTLFAKHQSGTLEKTISELGGGRGLEKIHSLTNFSWDSLLPVTETTEEEAVFPVYDPVGGGLELPEIRVPNATFRSVLTTYRSLLSSLEDGRRVDQTMLLEVADEVVDVFGDAKHSVIPGNSLSYFDDFTFHHSVNVSLLVTRAAAGVTTDRELLKRIALAGLLHDVGKSRVPAELLHKPGRLTDEEFEVLKEHPLAGAEILMGIDSIDPLSIAVAFSHHMHAGPSAYPKVTREMPLNWITRLVSVVDVYEALVAVRPYKDGLSSRTAFRIMLEMPGLQDRRELVKLLYESVGPYPTGVIVELNSGARAVVTGQNAADRSRPRVRILTDPDKNLLERPVDVDLAGTSEVPEEVSHAGPLAIHETVRITDVVEDPLRDKIAPEPQDILGSPLTDDSNLMGREG